MKKELTVTEYCEKYKRIMMIKLEKQAEDFAKKYFKTYGEYPKSYLDKLKSKG